MLPVEWTGTGCLLIRRAALLKVPRPWFVWDGQALEGEDVSFGKKATKAGVPTHCDLGLLVGHMGATCVDAAFMVRYQQAEVAR